MRQSRVVRGIQRATAVSVVVGLIGSAPVLAQGGPQGRGRMMGDGSQTADMSLIHELLDNGSKVTRTVTMRPDGVDTLTESDDPAVAKSIQAHADVLNAFIKNGRAEAMKNHDVPSR